MPTSASARLIFATNMSSYAAYTTSLPPSESKHHAVRPSLPRGSYFSASESGLKLNMCQQFSSSTRPGDNCMPSAWLSNRKSMSRILSGLLFTDREACRSLYHSSSKAQQREETNLEKRYCCTDVFALQSSLYCCESCCRENCGRAATERCGSLQRCLPNKNVSASAPST